MISIVAKRFFQHFPRRIYPQNNISFYRKELSATLPVLQNKVMSVAVSDEPYTGLSLPVQNERSSI